MLIKDIRITTRSARVVVYSPAIPCGNADGTTLDKIQYTKNGLQQARNAATSRPINIAAFLFLLIVCDERDTEPKRRLQKYFFVAIDVKAIVETGNMKPRKKVRNPKTVLLKPLGQSLMQMAYLGRYFKVKMFGAEIRMPDGQTRQRKSLVAHLWLKYIVSLGWHMAM